MLTLINNIQIQSSYKPINIEYRGLRFMGNCQDILLEQLELQGILLPYACRSGICGTCKVKLLVGKVSSLISNTVTEMSYILSCSCVPENDLCLE